MKQLTFITAIAFIFANCSSSHDPAAQKALMSYRDFVDSIYTQNEAWKMTSDTDVVEIPIDPNDPTTVRIDTIVTPPESKTTVVQDEFLGTQILKAYEPLKTDVEANVSKMDEKMKKEYETSRQKFESMMAK